MDAFEDTRKFLGSRFNISLVIVLIALGVVISLWGQPQLPSVSSQGARLSIQYFYLPTCPHCAAQSPVNDQLEREFPDIIFVKHDISIPSENQLLTVMAQNRSINPSELGTPTTFIGDRVFIGFDATSQPQQMRLAISACLAGNCTLGEKALDQERLKLLKGIELPFFGKSDFSALPLPLLAAVLGITGGFNACSVWVLVYLIGFMMVLSERKPIELAALSFILCSFALFFLFLSGSVRLSDALQYSHPFRIIAALFALGAGILLMKNHFDKNTLVPLPWAIVLVISVLAFSVDSIEFACSSALPNAFKTALVFSALQAWQYYAYILLYSFFFVLDNAIILGLAVLIVSSLEEKHARVFRIIGSLVLLLLGVILLFIPRILQ